MATGTRATGSLWFALLAFAFVACSAPDQSGSDVPVATDTPTADVPVGFDVASGADVPAIDSGTPCTTNAMCAPTEYCQGDACGSAGTCVARPTMCSGAADPYCGCDGMTYSNSCVAARAGVRVASAGACGGDAGLDASHDARADVSTDVHADVSADVHTPCTSSASCGSGMTCCLGTGVCYSSLCLACCMPAPGSCVTNASCTSTQYCAGMGCGTTGSCTARPTLCSALVAPVCGCDGVTYNNVCLANRAGVRVASTGACVNHCLLVRCALGSTCCPSTGICHPTSCTTCCAP